MRAQLCEFCFLFSPPLASKGLMCETPEKTKWQVSDGRAQSLN